jgi:hypothetical protein
MQQHSQGTDGKLWAGQRGDCGPNDFMPGCTRFQRCQQSSVIDD